MANIDGLKGPIAFYRGPRARNFYVRRYHLRAVAISFDNELQVRLHIPLINTTRTYHG